MKQLLETGGLAASALVEVVRRRRASGPLDPRWSFRTEFFQAMVRRMMARGLVRGPQWVRAAQAAVPSALPPALRKAVRFEPVVADGVPCRWVWPVRVPSSGPDAAIVYFHGGGYVSGSLDTHRELTARIASGAGVPVLAVDYRLAPEHRYPAGHDDCLRAVRWLRARGVDARRIAVAGDSAGGALAVATMIALRDAGEPQVAGAALLCPWVDPLAAGGSMVTNERFDMVTRANLVAWAHLYATEEEIVSPAITLASANLQGLPPLLIQAGELEVLRDQIHAFAARAKDAGVDATLETEPAMYHDFQLMGSILPEGLPAVERIVRFLRGVLSGAAHDAAR
ncbi:MAG: alpha/beta hydrolase [Deltaproteobacteria bacterium]|nr:alpha/beta hydrolase [Deltaproteobacteria bacterium]